MPSGGIRRTRSAAAVTDIDQCPRERNLPPAGLASPARLAGACGIARLISACKSYRLDGLILSIWRRICMTCIINCSPGLSLRPVDRLASSVRQAAIVKWRTRPSTSIRCISTCPTSEGFGSQCRRCSRMASQSSEVTWACAHRLGHRVCVCRRRRTT